MEPLVAERPGKVGISATAGDDGDVHGGADDLDRAAREFLRIRPRLFRIAYRILRNPVEAEDVMQDAWLRWQATDRAAVLNPEAFLLTTTTRLALNDAQSARRRRELPAGPRLLQLAGTVSGPEPTLEHGEAVEDAVLLLLATLTPTQRAAYVLREAFDYPYGDIAQLLQLRVANCRQLVRRARQQLAADWRRPVSVAAHRHLLDAFRTAARGGNIAKLERLLADGVVARVAPRVGSGDNDPAAA